jgi:hypothetical protein
MTQNIKTTINTSNCVPYTGTVTGTTLWGTTTATTAIFPSEKTFYCLGEEIKVHSYLGHEDLKTLLSLITVIGIELYEEFKKNGISFPKEVSDILDIKYKAWLRTSRIDSILKD